MLAHFASAFNSGDPAAIQATLSPEFWALSFSVRGHHQVAYTRDGAIRMIIERQEAGDRLEFVRAQVNELVGWDGAAHVGPVTFALRRSANAVELHGKGALYCAGAVRGIKVLGIGAS